MLYLQNIRFFYLCFFVFYRYTVRDVYDRSQRVKDSKRGMLGMCYILGPDLSLPRDQSIGYKNIMVVREALSGKRLTSLQHDFDKHAKWGVCQLGTSATFVDRSDLSESDSDLALFGAPGCFVWRGNVFSKNTGTIRPAEKIINRENFMHFHKNGLMGIAVTSGKFFDDQVYYVSGAPHAGSDDSMESSYRTGRVFFFHKDSSTGSRFIPEERKTLYGQEFGAGFGYSLAKVNANGDNHLDLLVGAPFRDGGKTGRGGAVYLFLSRDNMMKFHEVNSVVILGRQLESQFGLSMTSIGDLNMDRYEDFAIGAPYEDNGSGAVYVFFGGAYGLKSPTPIGRVVNAEDVAVQIIKSADISQQMPALIRSPSLRAFGSSLSGSIDMDGNGYPDLLVGSYRSDAIVLFRSRPIIDITTFVDQRSLKGIDPGKAGCEADPYSKDACFEFKTCFKVDENQINSRNGLNIKFAIEAEPNKPMSRVWLRLVDSTSSDESANKNNTVSGKIFIRPGDADHCTSIVGYVGSTHTDLQTPVQFSMSYSLDQEEPSMRYVQGSQLPEMNDYPILDQSQAKRKFQATFYKNCGEDDICQSNIVITPKLTDKDGIELKRTEVDGDYYQLELGTLARSELVLDLMVNNSLEPAYEATLDVFFPTAVTYKGNGEASEMKNWDLKNDTWLQVNIGNPLKGNNQGNIRVQLRFSPKDEMTEKTIVFLMSVNTTSEQEYDALTFTTLAIVRRAEVKVLGAGNPSLVHYGGVAPVLGESAMSKLSEIGPQIVQKFVVRNSGPSAVDILPVEIMWPYQVASNWKDQEGKWLLYLTEHPILKNGRGVCKLPAGLSANPLNLTSGVRDGIVARHAGYDPPEKLVFSNLDGQTNLKFYQSELNRLPAISEKLKNNNEVKDSPKKRRKKRSLEKVAIPRLVTVTNGNSNNDDNRITKRVVTLDCDLGTAKCIKITCELYSIQANYTAVIEVRSRLWNSTLADDYNVEYVDEVEIYSKAHVILNMDITQDLSDDHVAVLTIAKPKPSDRIDSSPDWWIILLSVLIGLLVLVLISLMLWKCGFFKRHRHSEEDEYGDMDHMFSVNFEKAALNGKHAY